jgi:hypothetical protein
MATRQKLVKPTALLHLPEEVVHGGLCCDFLRPKALFYEKRRAVSLRYLEVVIATRHIAHSHISSVYRLAAQFSPLYQILDYVAWGIKQHGHASEYEVRPPVHSVHGDDATARDSAAALSRKWLCCEPFAQI